MRKKRLHRGAWTVRLEVAPGLEASLTDELTDLGLEATTSDPGGVDLRLDAQGLLTVQRWSRVAARATVRLARVQAPSLEGLAERIRKLPWSDYAVPRQPIEVRVTSSRSRLRHKKTVAGKVERAIQDALRGPRLPGGRPPGTPLRVGVRIVDDVATIRLDASGERLQKRGWRRDPGRAPLRENLAVGVLRAAGWHPGEALIDPMTGSGTFAVEAALWTLDRAPGARRSFDCETWPCWPGPTARRPTPVRDTGAPIVAADRDARSIERVRANAQRAGVGRRMGITHTALEELSPPNGASRGLVVMNPPWGDRLGDSDHARALHRRWRSRLGEAFPTFRTAVLVPDAPWARAVWAPGARAASQFQSGGTSVCLWVHEPA